MSTGTRLGPLHGFAVALQLLTRLPVPRNLDLDDRDLGRATAWYPVVGLLVGGLLFAAGWATHLAGGKPLGIVAVLVAEVLITGALHDDGLADSADAFGGGRSVEERLRILKDSRIGTYGALALILATAVRAGALWEISTEAWFVALTSAHLAGRAAMVPVLAALPYARHDGVAGRARGALSTSRAAGVIVVAGLLCGTLLTLYGSWRLWTALALGAALVVVPAASVAFLRSRLGGVTGDCLGATCVLAEVTALLGAVVG